jgi:hypothetical protein
MSLQIDTLDDLKALLKTCNLKLDNVADVQELLRTINANYNPDSARVHVARQVGVVVPGSALGAAAGTSFLLGVFGGITLAALAVIWGVAGLVSVVAVIFGGIALITRRDWGVAAAPAPPPLGQFGLPAQPFAERSTNVTLPDNH